MIEGSRSVVFGHGYFFWQSSLRAAGFDSPRAQALAVTACSLTVVFPCGAGALARV